MEYLRRLRLKGKKEEDMFPSNIEAITEEDIKATRKVIGYYLEKGLLTTDDAGDLGTELIRLSDAIIDDMPSITLADKNRKKALRSRREAVGNIVATGLFATLVVGVFGVAAYEVIKAEWDKSELDKKKKYEAEHSLSRTKSSPSVEGWRISHPKKEPGVSYKDLIDKNHVVISAGQVVKFSADSQATDIQLQDYLDSRNNLIVMIRLKLLTGAVEEWLLNSGDPQTENSIVLFENGKIGRYVRISRTKSNQASYLLTEVTKPE